MNFNPYPGSDSPGAPPFSYERMSKWEIMYRFGPIDGLWWKLMPGTVIEVAWPSSNITIDHTHPKWDWSLGATYQEGFSSDPNDHYRPWLEKHVGRQGWDWNWRIGQTNPDRLEIKFRRGREKYATIASLRWT